MGTTGIGVLKAAPRRTRRRRVTSATRRRQYSRHRRSRLNRPRYEFTVLVARSAGG
jgi:hypothetical protein